MKDPMAPQPINRREQLKRVLMSPEEREADAREAEAVWRYEWQRIDAHRDDWRR